MLIAVLSDIHGNLEAFQAVIERIDSRNPDKVICLGDLIGYGPNPEEVIQLFVNKGYFSVLGNHEAAIHNSKIRNWLNFQAKENSVQTERLLSPNSIDFCNKLEKNIVVENALFVHGFPPESVLQYITYKKDKDLEKFFFNSDIDLFFVGHTHDLFLTCWNGISVEKIRFTPEVYTLQPDSKYIVNAGSVGQPRDGSNSAKFIFWDTVAKTLEIAQVPYDYKKTTRKIKERGFPDAYGYRLW